MWAKEDARIVIFVNLIIAGVLLCAAIIDTAYGGPLVPSIISVVMSAIAIGIALRVYDNIEDF